MNRTDALKRLTQCRANQRDAMKVLVAGEIVDALICQFCKGRPVSDAASWRDGKPRPPLPCPRCGEVYEEAS